MDKKSNSESQFIMKNIFLLLCGALLIVANAARAEILFGPGTITIATNQTILITTLGGDAALTDFYIDGVDVEYHDQLKNFGFFALTGPHNFVVSPYFDDVFVSFQRLTNSSITTVVTGPNSTKFINVPAGKTILLLPPLGDFSTIKIQPQDSTSWFTWNASAGFPSTSVPGPVTIRVATGSFEGTALSYYFTDDVVQFPPNGLLTVPAPILEVNIEKSNDLTNWMPSATFHTEAEAKAFYRLKMLR